MRRVVNRDQRGVALPSPVVLLSAAAVVLAAVAFIFTGGHGDDRVDLTAQPAAPSTGATAGSTAPSTGTKTTKPKHTKTAEPVQRGKVKVLVYNDTNVTGLASKVGAQVAKAGWDFVAADNWAGTIPATTVYYPAKLKAEAKQLALDLGIKRIYPRDPSADGMLDDGLTVILLGPLS